MVHGPMRMVEVYLVLSSVNGGIRGGIRAADGWVSEGADMVDRGGPSSERCEEMGMYVETLKLNGEGQMERHQRCRRCYFRRRIRTQKVEVA